LTAFIAGLQCWVCHAAELGHGLTEVFMVMGRQVIGDVVDHSIVRKGPDMGCEDTTERMPIVIGNALAIDFTVCRVQESDQVGNAIAFVVEVLKDWLTGCYRQVGRQTLESLNACAFIEAIQVLRRVQI